MSSTGHLPELESLRSQVADLARALAERDQAILELQRRQTVSERREDERRLSLTQFAVDHAQDGILWADDSNRFIYANEAACRSLGYSNEELLTLSISDISPYHDPLRFQQRLDYLKKGTTATYESVHRRKDRTEFPVEVSVNYLEHEGRAYTCKIIRDITERKRIEQERLQVLHHLQNIMETVPDFMFTLDIQGNLVNWNRRVGEVTGYSPEELLNKPALAFVPPEQQTRTAAAIQQAFTEGYAELDGLLLTKNLRTIPYHWTGALLKNLHGEPIGITGIGRDVSERKRTEEELRQQRRHLVEAQAIGHLASWNWDIDSGDVQWSDEQFRIFGHEPGTIAVTYDTFLTSLYPDDHDRVLAAINDALLGKNLYDVECRIVRPNGQVRYIHACGNVHRDTTGHPLSIAGTNLDITERKQVEEALRASEDRWQLAVRGTNDGIWDWNIQAGKVFYSSRWKAMRGFADYEIADSLDEWRSRIHPDDLDNVLRSVDAYLAKQRPEFCEEYRVQKKDGSYMWILDRGVAHWNEAGRPTRMVGSESDISERKQAEEALRASEARFRTLAETTTDWMWEINEHGVYTHCSPKIRDFLGYEPGEALDKTPFDFMPEEEARRVAALFGPIAAARKPFAGIENTNRRKDGRLVVLECRGVPIIDADGVFRGYRGFDHDITERKQAEEALLQRSRQQQVLAQFGQFALRTRELQTLMDEAVRRIAQTLAADYCKVLELRTDGTALLLRAGVGWHDGLVGQATVSAGTASQAGYTLSSCEPVTVEDLRTEQRFSGPPLLFDHGVVSGLSVIIQGERNPWGVLGVHTTTRRTFAQDDVNFVQAMANILGAIIERTGAEAALLESEERLRSFMRNSPSPVFCKSLDGRYLYVNPEFERLFQLPADHIIGKTDYDIFPPEQADQFAVNDRQVFHEEHAIEFEETARYYDGIHTSLVVKFPLCGADGAVNRFLGGIVTDITARKRTEEALQSSQEKLRQALQASSTGLWDWNTETNEVSLSREWKRQLGYEEAELTDDFETWETRLHPDDHARAIAYVRAYLAKPVGDYQQEFRLRHKDGTYRWIETRASFVTEPDGRQVRLLGSHADITARKQTEEVLRVGEERYARATAVGKVGVWELDVNAGIYHSDANLKALFGYAPDELSTNPYAWLNLVHPDDQPVAMATWDRIVSGVTDAYHDELRMVRKDGMVIWTEVRGHAVRDQDGRLTHLIGATVDITDRKEAENALTASERQLRTVLDALPVGVWFTDRTGQSILANPAAKHIWSNIKRVGLQTADNSRGWWETVEGTGEPHRWALSHALTSSEPSLNETLDLECLDGTRKTIRNTTVPVQDENGAVLGAIVLNEDITALQQAQQALKLTQFSVDHSVEGFFWIGADARILHVNDAACRMLEYSRDELTAMTVHDIDPNFPQEVWPAHWEELKQKGSMTFESKHWSKTSRVLDTEVTVNYLYYDGREYHCAIMRDIGERKKVQQALRESEERFRQLVEGAPLGMTVLDGYGRYVKVNHAFCTLVGYREDELLGQTYALFTHPYDLSSHQTPTNEVLAGKRTEYRIEKRYVRKNGETVWVTVNATSLALPGSSGPHVIAIIEDITERKQAEEALLQRERDLRAAIDERERISQDLHDGILQSLYAVGLCLEACKPLFKQQQQQQQQRKKATAKLMLVFNQAIGQLNHVMAEVRNFIAGLESQVLQGGDFATALRTMVQSMVSFHPVKCKVDIDEAMARRLSTEQALHLMHIVHESLSNSLRHSQAKRTTVSLKQLAHSVRLSVTDDGLGFNPATAHGVGHGLTNMAARAQKLGGRFAVRSKPRQGTKILFDLPKETVFAHN